MIKPMLLTASLVALSSQAFATPEQDKQNFQDFFQKKFDKVEYQDFGNGVYALDEISRENWEAIEEFPPYEMEIDAGQALFEKPFKNGKSLADCFPNKGVGIKQNYPYFDEKTEKVRTLEQDINTCRKENGEKPFKYKKGNIAQVSAYMAYTSRNNIIDIKIPDNPKALAAYEAGKKFFYAKRGQLNFACADCHITSAGQSIRSDILSPALGQTTHFPVYRSKWGSLGTMHRRYGGCNKQVRAKPFKAQSDEYRNLEYFHTYMSNGLQINGPGSRK